MRLSASLYLGLLYVLSSFAFLAAESRAQPELLTYQHPKNFAQEVLPRLDEVTIDELQSLFSDGSLTSEDLVNVSHSSSLNLFPGANRGRHTSSAPGRSIPYFMRSAKSTRMH